MLHEVLLALSGHPSPLFEEHHCDDGAAGIHSLLSPSEAALLRSIGILAERHRQLRNHVQWIISKHKSTICRAVATSIQQTFLARFQKRILEVESKILTKNATIVGAYDIVPLASIVGQFDDWHRLMSWLWKTACLMQPPDTPRASSGCSGAAVIDYLRGEASTGFPEIESAALELGRTAELAWLRQLVPWIVYGKLPAHAGGDFFVQAAPEDVNAFCKRVELIPGVVTPTTVSSIVFIGTCLNRIRQLPKHRQPTAVPGTLDDRQLAAERLNHLSSLRLPMSQAQLAHAVSSIRLSLSQNVLQRLLPMTDIVQLLSCLRTYFLLGHGEFATALVDEAESRLLSRQQSMGRLLQQDPLKAMQSLSVKDAELQQVLSNTWKRLARDEHVEDDVLDFARKHVTLGSLVRKPTRPSSSESASVHLPQVSSVSFNDLLFPTASNLSLNVEPPLDLFVSANEIESYTSTNAYLLAMKRAQMRLSELWRRTGARRDRTVQPKAAQRTKNMRKVWATSSAALHLISETAAYLEGEVVKGSCEHFEHWVEKPTSVERLDESLGSAHHEAYQTAVAQRDPETLAAAHRAFLASLVYALLLTDVGYTRELRSLLGNIDALIAFFNGLLDIQQKADLEEDEGGVVSDYTREEEARMSLELDRARKKVDSDLRSVTSRLRQLDHERIGSGRYLEVRAEESGGFETWKGGGVDRLLMKLEFGRMRDDEYDIV